jgi:hypothetical protein
MWRGSIFMEEREKSRLQVYDNFEIISSLRLYVESALWVLFEVLYNWRDALIKVKLVRLEEARERWSHMMRLRHRLYKYTTQ